MMGKFTTAQEALDSIAARCEGAVIRNHVLRARCPAHRGTTTTSLAVSVDGDKILMSCHGGCEIDSILIPLDMTRADLFLATSDPLPPKRRIECTYDYTDAHGTVLYQAVRYVPKEFRPRRPEGIDDWTWNLNGVTRVPYHLPEILEAIAHHELVAICEGEKDADNVQRCLGITATCSIGGKGQAKGVLKFNFPFSDKSPIDVG